MKSFGRLQQKRYFCAKCTTRLIQEFAIAKGEIAT